MKKLTVIRHGKSGYELGLSDKKRTLAERGISDSKLVATKYLPNLTANFLMISSTAIRAATTASIFAKIFLVSNDDIEFNDDLYTFDSRELEKIIKSTNDNVTNLLIFGHNDAITDFVNKFGDIYIDNVPTSGLVSINFESDSWSELQKGKTIKTIFPSELK
jgi:phosphohistidine phosphatase